MVSTNPMLGPKKTHAAREVDQVEIMEFIIVSVSCSWSAFQFATALLLCCHVQSLDVVVQVANALASFADALPSGPPSRNI